MQNYNYISQIAAPSVEPLTMAEIKLFMKIDGSTYDDTLSALLSASRQMAESYIGCSIISQTWQISLKSSQITKEIELPKGPLKSVTEALVILADDSEKVISVSEYSLVTPKNQIIFKTLPDNIKELKISYIAGYSDDSVSVPALMKQGLLSNISYIYEHRSSGNVINDISRNLYDFYRKPRL